MQLIFKHVACRIPSNDCSPNHDEKGTMCRVGGILNLLRHLTSPRNIESLPKWQLLSDDLKRLVRKGSYDLVHPGDAVHKSCVYRNELSTARDVAKSSREASGIVWQKSRRRMFLVIKDDTGSDLPTESHGSERR